MEEKTNVMRTLERLKLPYRHYAFDTGGGAISGTEVADILGKDPAGVFKTLVTVGKSGKYYVFMIPVAEELDLKKAAKAAGEKSIDMLKSKELLPLTGYVHGGCSPIGMKKQFPTFIHMTAADVETITFSAGKIGFQVELPLLSLQKAVRVSLADVVVE
ncbi:MAG: Cys-tRNA(Pro) deacylase [Clostridiales bacterium]|nr:Cys-tRNA(Pro) deacylase [Clostridiales bacterium]